MLDWRVVLTGGDVMLVLWRFQYRLRTIRFRRSRIVWRVGITYWWLRYEFKACSTRLFRSECRCKFAKAWRKRSVMTLKPSHRYMATCSCRRWVIFCIDTAADYQIADRFPGATNIRRPPIQPGSLITVRCGKKSKSPRDEADSMNSCITLPTFGRLNAKDVGHCLA